MTAKRRRLKDAIPDLWDNVAISESVPDDMIVALSPNGTPVGCIFNLGCESKKSKMGAKPGSKLWQVWQLAPDSDPQERTIITTADGEEEICGIIDAGEAEKIVAAHNKSITGEN